MFKSITVSLVFALGASAIASVLFGAPDLIILGLLFVQITVPTFVVLLVFSGLIRRLPEKQRNVLRFVIGCIIACLIGMVVRFTAVHLP
jgi:uncharacterized BrkB/YihY/UPF0761 family membrane protein